MFLRSYKNSQNIVDMSKPTPPIQIVPLNDINVDFKSNKLSVSTPIMDNSLNYTHVGNYIVSASSYASDETAPYNAFNIISTKYWQTDFSGNANFEKLTVPAAYSVPYSQDPFSNSNISNSSYQGGGADENTWKTNVGSNPISGEWIQIQIPSETPFFLYKYSILTPIPVGGILTFPTKIMVVGSNDGKAWELVDQQNIKEPIDTSNQKPVEFNINVMKRYTYFRLVISEMPKQNGVFRLHQWALYGTITQDVNRDTFTNMDIGPNFIPFSTDTFRPYIDYKASIPLDDSNPNKKNEEYVLQTDINKKASNIGSDIVLPGILFTILAISFIIYSNKK